MNSSELTHRPSFSFKGESSLHHVVRRHTANELDPFILFEEFHLNCNDAFPKALYKEFEGITYLLEGKLHHADDLGNDSTLSEGDVQGFKAGKGIHSLDRAFGSSDCRGLRIWLNTGKSFRKDLADYRVVRHDDMPSSSNGTVFIKEIAGGLSPFHTCCGLVMQDVELKKASVFTTEVAAGHHVIVYNLSGPNGNINVGKTLLAPGNAIQIDDTEELQIVTDEADARFIFLSAKPVGDKIDPELLEPFE